MQPRALCPGRHSHTVVRGKACSQACARRLQQGACRSAALIDLTHKGQRFRAQVRRKCFIVVGVLGRIRSVVAQTAQAQPLLGKVIQRCQRCGTVQQPLRLPHVFGRVQQRAIVSNSTQALVRRLSRQVVGQAHSALMGVKFSGRARFGRLLDLVQEMGRSKRCDEHRAHIAFTRGLGIGQSAQTLDLMRRGRPAPHFTQQGSHHRLQVWHACAGHIPPLPSPQHLRIQRPFELQPRYHQVAVCLRHRWAYFTRGLGLLKVVVEERGSDALTTSRERTLPFVLVPLLAVYARGRE